MLVLAVTVHNIPEGMAVGVAFAGWLSDHTSMTMAGAFALSIGIAVQNFPEGAIISLPLRGEGMSRKRAFACGVLSGVVEPVAAFLTICATSLIVPLLPYLLSFAAGAMLYVVVAELIPGLFIGQEGVDVHDGVSGENHDVSSAKETALKAGKDIGILFFAVGFSVMMILDVAMG